MGAVAHNWMRRATSLRDKPDFNNASARRRRFSSRSALPFSLGTGIRAPSGRRHPALAELVEDLVVGDGAAGHSGLQSHSPQQSREARIGAKGTERRIEP